MGEVLGFGIALSIVGILLGLGAAFEERQQESLIKSSEVFRIDDATYKCKRIQKLNYKE